MAVGYTLMEEALMKDGQYETTNLDTYLMPGISDLPFQMKTIPIEDLPEHDFYVSKGCRGNWNGRCCSSDRECCI